MRLSARHPPHLGGGKEWKTGEPPRPSKQTGAASRWLNGCLTIEYAGRGSANEHILRSLPPPRVSANLNPCVPGAARPRAPRASETRGRGALQTPISGLPEIGTYICAQVGQARLAWTVSV